MTHESHIAALDEIIVAVFGTLSAEDAMVRLKASKLAYGRLNSLERASELGEHTAAIRREFFRRAH